MSSVRRKRVVVLISGRGSNMQALIAATMDPSFPGQIVGVIANKPDAPGLETARRHDIAAIPVDQKAYDSREAHEAAVLDALAELDPDIVCLAGYMRLLSATFVQRYAGRLINIHPSLLPLFPGLETHERALAAGMRIHGCTVHFVTERMDEGPIIAQAAIAVEAGDTPDTLSERLLRAEHRLYPHALKLILDGTVRMTNGRAVVESRRRLSEEPDGLPESPLMLVSPDARRG
ncbi:phosphoribosylglycinamide formyltransferase [Aurantimonas endophytica]|uniref:Phosphoribosylglycinamide formyltransferase n=1 Tax=Aurantimonas endophytica TaxID=1522175 RepID=A0A7W6MMP3_9HYPH|nr:phosphoribosylglycinamide formyltransferase [Aurantimonas endophytica]MBB4001052.1 phosphoribosylglycinamide formyltransferase-1 [Aurantimonas endophytica]MCO6403292.1 phosphoribosylglycinamide formyltransferase [Aurantimonas endophytica]